MNNVTERLIARVENAINVGAEVEDIVQLLAGHGVTGYDAWLAYKAAEVSVRMFQRGDLRSAKQNAPTRQMRAVRV